MAELLPSSLRLPAFENTEAVRKLLSTQHLVADDWQAQELLELLHHQLASSLAFDLGTLDAARAIGVQQLSENLSRPGITFGEILADTTVHAGFLEAVKWFAKKDLVSADPALPRPIAVYLYNLSIVNALRFCELKISSSPIRQIMASMARLLQEPWLTGSARERMESAFIWLSARPQDQ